MKCPTRIPFQFWRLLSNYKIIMIFKIDKLFILLFFPFFIGCFSNKKIIKEKFPSEIIIQKIICKNLSEKFAGIGSKNDEIILFVYKKDEVRKPNLIWHSELLIFEKEKEILIDQNISIDFKSLSFVLIEIDEKRNIEDLNVVLLKALEEEKGKEEIKELILDDDLLGIKKIDIAESEKKNTLQFWGIHLLDEYEYELEFKINYE